MWEAVKEEAAKFLAGPPSAGEPAYEERRRCQRRKQMNQTLAWGGGSGRAATQEYVLLNAASLMV